MVISELTGGVGNQLFQYATGFALARRLKSRYALDLRHYEEYERARAVTPHLPSRPFALDRFAITAHPMTAPTRLWVELSHARTSARPLKRLVGRLPYPKLRLLVDPAQGDDPRLHAALGSSYLAGTWQSESLFKDAEQALREEFRFRKRPVGLNADLIERMRERTAISVHFRRTDYLHSETLIKPCSLDYYARGFADMDARFPDARYFIFTDDADWVRHNATLPADSILVSHNSGVDDVEDMRLMAQCDHFIIANSSFSWWGAWLSSHQQKHVVAPAIWYEAGHGSEHDLVPKAWLRL